MVEQSVPRTRGKHPEGEDKHPHPSTKELVADGPFCLLLAQDMGLKVSTTRSALIGEPKVRCIRVVEWVMRNAPDDPKRRAKILLWWAKKRKTGAFREQGDVGGDGTRAGVLDRESERFERLAEALARMWVERPESLAEALRALERDRNGRS